MVPVSSYDSQFQSLIQWFKEFSEVQKSDFLDIVVYAIDPEIFPQGQPGIPSPKPESIYRIREKLFLEWYPVWGQTQRKDLLDAFRNIDSEFMEKVDAKIEAGPVPVNQAAGDDQFVLPEVIDEDLANLHINGDEAGDAPLIDYVVNNEPVGSDDEAGFDGEVNGQQEDEGQVNGQENGEIEEPQE